MTNTTDLKTQHVNITNTTTGQPNPVSDLENMSLNKRLCAPSIISSNFLNKKPQIKSLFKSLQQVWHSAVET